MKDNFWCPLYVFEIFPAVATRALGANLTVWWNNLASLVASLSTFGLVDRHRTCVLILTQVFNLHRLVYRCTVISTTFCRALNPVIDEIASSNLPVNLRCKLTDRLTGLFWLVAQLRLHLDVLLQFNGLCKLIWSLNRALGITIRPFSRFKELCCAALLSTSFQEISEVWHIVWAILFFWLLLSSFWRVIRVIASLDTKMIDFGGSFAVASCKTRVNVFKRLQLPGHCWEVFWSTKVIGLTTFWCFYELMALEYVRARSWLWPRSFLSL